MAKVAISCTPVDALVINTVTEILVQNGIDVVMMRSEPPDTAEEKRENGRTITSCAVFIPVISDSYLTSRSHQDELALAVFSDKLMFPIVLNMAGEMLEDMEVGLKLQIKDLPWIEIEQHEGLENIELKLMKLAQNILSAIKDNQTDGPMEESDFSPPKRKRPYRPMSARSPSKKAGDEQPTLTNSAFWQKHFASEDSVNWERFWEALCGEYQLQISALCKGTDNTWVEETLKRDFRCIQGTLLTQELFKEFCTIDGKEYPMLQRIEDTFAQALIIKRVFDVESTVRFDAIEELSKYQSNAVLEALLALINDTDPNVRAIACISLARTETTDRSAVEALLPKLQDGDRIVRQSACLALGHLKAEIAIPKLTNLWRNDFISTVREAAQVALQRIGGAEAEKAMRITKLLDTELKELNAK